MAQVARSRTAGIQTLISLKFLELVDRAGVMHFDEEIDHGNLHERRFLRRKRFEQTAANLRLISVAAQRIERSEANMSTES